MWHGGEFVDRHALEHCGDDFVDEFAPDWSHTASAQDFSGHGIGEQFHKSILRFHD